MNGTPYGYIGKFQKKHGYIGKFQKKQGKSVNAKKMHIVSDLGSLVLLLVEDWIPDIESNLFRR